MMQEGRSLVLFLLVCCTDVLQDCMDLFELSPRLLTACLAAWWTDYVNQLPLSGCVSSVVVRVSDSSGSEGREFDSRSVHCRVA